MNVIYSVKDYVTNVFDFNQATASGAIDVVAVQHEDGSFRCTPFHVHFGRIELAQNADKQVRIYVNGQLVDDVRMKLGAAGEAFFVDGVEQPVDDDYSTSPIVSPSSSTSTNQPTSHITTPPPPSTTSSSEQTGRRNSSVATAEWHDSYRVVTETRPPLLRREGSVSSVSSERLTWGWGALPMVRSTSIQEFNFGTDDLKGDDDLPRMTKNDSVYFDAMDTESVHSNAYFSDHPCMSLCGHLLEDAETREEAHAIFSDHIISYELFREDPSALLQNRDLRFLIDGKICPFNTEVQAHLVSRVLFPSSQPLPMTCAWSNALQKRRLAEKAEASYWFGYTDDDEDDHDADDEPVIQMSKHEDTQQRKRWFHWFPRSSSSESPKPRVTPEAQLPNSQESPAQSKFFRKSLRPSQEELQKMDLHYGPNDIEFVVKTADGEERVSAKIFVWAVSAKIIIAEIDGAISRPPTSRRLSTLLPIMERDNSSSHHDGALQFFSRVARNGYHVIYLTGRGLSQADLIHDMLRSPTTDNRERCLPSGPVLLSPDRLLEPTTDDPTPARDFKIAALNGIRTLFPADVNPFYAAFGKTLADSIVFTQVGVFPGKVFLVDEGDGRLRHRSMINFQESYSSLVGMVDKMFPPVCSPSPRHQFRTQSSRLTDSTAPSSSRASSESSYSSSPLRRALSANDDVASEVLSSHVRTRSMGDEAYNDVNFWRIKPGSL
ncbi:hypothetical protein PINS_up005612 [Pythium insidiosum]|nr:hypothetical protein PINS_up005612 [Pythium insidiosum]